MLQINEDLSNSSKGNSQNQLNLKQDESSRKEGTQLQNPFDSLSKQDINNHSNQINSMSFDLTINKHKLKKNFDFQGNKDDKTLQSNQVNEEEEEIQLDQSINSNVNKKTVFINQYTKVQYKLNEEQNQLTVVKTNVGSQVDLLFKEIEKLEYLKGYGIALNIIDKNENSFELIVGKTDLDVLHQKVENYEIFETFFLILLIKLNRMHDLGIAHSDIKPGNIMLSYDNQLYFIDFDSSVFLSDFKNYLKCFTPSFNLDKFLYKFGQVEYKGVKFFDAEQVKLCDRTQLALTFLYLLCNKEQQTNLFFPKKFNKLIQDLQNRKSQQRQIILSIFSKILNEADPEIQIIDIGENNIFHINSLEIDFEIQNSNDIIFKDDQYQLQRLDKYSVILIYLLLQNSFDIYIEPNQMIIIPLQGNKEYEYICEKYPQIQSYLYSLINYESIDTEFDYLNIAEYIKTLKNQTIKIQLDFDDRLKMNEKIFLSIKSLKYLDTLQIKIIPQQTSVLEYLDQFLVLKEQLPDFKIDLKINDCFFPSFKIQKLNQHQNKITICLNEMKQIKQILQKLLSTSKIEDYFKLLTIIHPQKYQNGQKLVEINEFFHLSEQLEEKQFEELSLQIKRFSKQYNELYQFNQQQNEQKDEISHYENSLIQFCELINIFDEILNNSYKKVLTYEKLYLKFYNFTFIDVLIWEKIILIKQISSMKQIEIIIVNCKFSLEILEKLKEIRSKFSEIQFEFNIEFDEYLKNENIDETGYQLNLHNFNKQTLNQKSFKIHFFKEFHLNLFQNEINFQNNIMSQNYKIIAQEVNFMNQTNYNQQVSQIKQLELLSQKFKMPLIKNLEIQHKGIKYKYKINNKYFVSAEIKNQKDVNILIQDFKNNMHYDQFEIAYNNNYFCFFLDQMENPFKGFQNICFLQIKFHWKNNNNNQFSQFQQLFQVIVNNPNYYQIFYNSLKINILKSFDFIKIDYNIFYDWTQVLFLMIGFYKKYSLMLKDDYLKDNSEKQSLVENIIINLKQFNQDYCLLSQESIFKNELSLIEFEIYIDLGDKLSFLILELDNLFKNNWIIYNIKCSVNLQTLDCIFETINSLKSKKTLFLFSSFELSKEDSSKFISQIEKNQQASYNFYFVFQSKDCENKFYTSFTDEEKTLNLLSKMVQVFQQKESFDQQLFISDEFDIFQDFVFLSNNYQNFNSSKQNHILFFIDDSKEKQSEQISAFQNPAYQYKLKEQYQQNLSENQDENDHDFEYELNEQNEFSQDEKQSSDSINQIENNDVNDSQQFNYENNENSIPIQSSSLKDSLNSSIDKSFEKQQINEEKHEYKQEQYKLQNLQYILDGKEEVSKTQTIKKDELKNTILKNLLNYDDALNKLS